MELCASRAPSNAPPVPYCRLLPTSLHPRFRPSLHLKQSLFRLHSNSENVSCKHSSPIRIASMSEETPSELSKFDGETSRRIGIVEDVPPAEKTPFENSVQVETHQEDSPLDEQRLQPFGELFDKLNLELNIKDSYSLLLYGGGALVSAWLLSAVVSAVDSIPLLPQLMEVVGFSYSLWFTTRYLIFKKNRDELDGKIEELRQQVLGSDKD